jgi:hypothetical protein
MQVLHSVVQSRAKTEHCARRNLLRSPFLVPLVALVGCAPQPPQIVKTLPPMAFEPWAPQEFATNVQDWDRVATKIADKLEAGGLLRVSTTVNLVTGQPRPQLSVHYDPSSTASRQVADAIYNEIINRGGLVTDVQVDLKVSIVSWGSRLDSQLYSPRREGVWLATLRIGQTGETGEYVMSYREPFYVLDSDVGLYVQLPAPPLSPDQALAATARPLSYTAK